MPLEALILDVKNRRCHKRGVSERTRFSGVTSGVALCDNGADSIVSEVTRAA